MHTRGDGAYMMQAILIFTLGSFVLGGICLYGSGRAVDAETQRRRWIKYLTYLVIVHVVIGIAIAGPFYFTAFMTAVAIVGAHELIRVTLSNGRPPARSRHTIWIFCLYSLLAYAAVRFSQQSTSGEILFVYLVTAAFDGTSQLTGQSIGRLPLAPRISPNKTVEGALGGLAAAILTAFALRSLADLSTLQAPFVGLLLAIAALTGDLAASFVKRLHGVKDFGTLLPEHGGVMDRFDSLLVAAPSFLVFVLWSR